jgi:hypothetical protein
MIQRSLPVVAPAVLACTLAAPAFAGFMQATAKVYSPRPQPSETRTSSGDILGPTDSCSTTLNWSKTVSDATQVAEVQGIVQPGSRASMASHAYSMTNYSSTAAVFEGTITASDIIVSRSDGTGAGSPVLVTAYFKPTGGVSFYGAPPNYSLTFNYARFQWSASAVTSSGTTSMDGYFQRNLTGHTDGSALEQRYALTFEARVGEAFSLSLFARLQAWSQGGPEVLNGPLGIGITDAAMTFGMDGANESAFVADSTAFVLPEGYTANSANLGIVDNQLSAVPAPGAIALLGMAGLAGSRRRR